MTDTTPVAANGPVDANGTAIDLRPSAEGLIDIASRLIVVLERETALLREMKAGEIGALQPEKTRLIAAYEERSRGLNAHGQSLGVLEAAVRQELRETISRFDDAAKDNALALRAAHQANERLMQAIVDALNQQRNRAEGYGADGAHTGVEPSLNDRVALTFDERL
jgi:flagellar biosynthesis/type III secretory pathway chaperone